MTTTKTVEQLKAELAAAQEAVAAQEAAVRKQIREAEQAEARAKAAAAQEEINAKMDKAFALVVEKFGPMAVKKNRFELVLRHGISISIDREEKKVSSYRSAYTGRYLVTVGYEYAYGAEACRSRYPSKQDGTFSMDKIAVKVADLTDAKTSKQSAAAAKLSQKLEAERLADELNTKHATRLCSPSYTHSSSKGGGRYEYTEYIAAAGHVYIGATQYNPAQVEVYVRMMAEIKALATKA